MSRRALVMGLGSFGGGADAARFLARRGDRVTVTDLRGPEDLGPALAGLADHPDVRTVLGRHEERDFDDADLVVANPAVRPDHPLLERARAAGARVTSAVELFLEAADARLVGVTGTQGKSSTCHLTAELLRGAGFRVHLTGNIGGGLLELLGDLGSDDVCVLELSSYQLAALGDPAALGTRRRVEAVCVTNVVPDHLERHGTFSEYAAAKARLLELVHPEGTVVLSATDPVSRALSAPRGRVLRFATEPGTGAELAVEGEHFVQGDTRLARLADLDLPGTFQRANALAALGLARALGAAPEALAATLPRVRGLPHRLEDLGFHAGRRVYDNGVSTTPDSTLAALESLPPGTRLIAGGRKKDLDFTELVRAAREREVDVTVFGEAAEELARLFTAGGVAVRRARGVRQALRLALDATPEGGQLLFSPACASFDAYPNFKARALEFQAAVAELDPAVHGVAP